MFNRIPVAVALFLIVSISSADESPDISRDSLNGRVIREVVINNADIFDLSDPEENTWLYRTINKLHATTKRGTVYSQLLFRPGQAFDKRAIEESERILRSNKYLYDAGIEARPIGEDEVAVTVNTRDVWSLMPEIWYSRNSGRSRSRVGLEESNLLGRGQLLEVLRDNDIERSENIVRFSDRNFGRSWVSVSMTYSDNSDGSTHALAVQRPFYELDARWAAGVNGLTDDRRSKLYQFGEESAEYRHERDYAHVFGGWSAGLRNDKARRWTAGFVYDDNRFSEAAESILPPVIPADRKLVYPYVGFELVEDDFATASNRDQIDRTEDFQMGLHVRASLGWADTALGSNRDAAVFSASSGRGFGSLKDSALFLSAWTRGRLESGSLANTTVSFSARHYLRQSPKRTLVSAASGTAGEALDLDNPVALGGGTGLRGYPYRYQVGESKFLATIEQRYYTDWHLWRLARIGGAIFADAGRVWGDNPLGDDNRGWLVDVGIGLRLQLARIAAGRVIHIDLAFPLNGDSTIDDMQVLIETKKSF